MKKIFFIFFSILGFSLQTHAEKSDDAVASAYQDYIKETKYYIATLKDVDDAILDWRKKKLAETFDSKLSAIEQNLSLSNDNLIEEFNKFLKSNGTQSLDDVLMIRLAQLYFERSNLKFNQDMKAFQKQGSATAEIPIPHYDQTIKISKKFLETFPQSPIADKALYMLGYCYEEMMKSHLAIDFYKKLLTQFPASEYADEVTWRLGEIDYSQSKYTEAKNLYEKLAKTKGPFFTKALYRMGASQFEQKNFADAAKTFQRLIHEIDAQHLTDLEDISLNDEAMDYLATILTQNKPVEIANTLKPELFYRMGLLYKKRLDEKSMRTVYVMATQKYSNSRFMPLYYSELIDSFDAANDDEHANYYRSMFIQILNEDSKWWTMNDKYKNTIFQTQDLLEYSLLKSAEFYADKGYRKKDYELLKVAKNRYSNFISQYSWSPYHDTALLELGDLEYYLGNYPAASNDYYEVVNVAESDVLKEEAAYSLIWSEVKKVNYDLNFNSKPINLSHVLKSSFSPQEKSFVQAALFYVDKVKTSFRKDKILYKLAELHAEHGQLDEAAVFLNSIISNTDRSSETTVWAYKFLSEIYNTRGDYTSSTSINELYHTTLFGSNVESLDKDNFRQRYRDKLEKALNLEMGEQYLQAAQEFEKVEADTPDSSMNDYLNFKILDLYIKSAQFDRAVGYIDRIQASPYRAEALFMKAYVQFQLAQFESAADLFEEFTLKYKAHPWFTQALLNVVNLRRQMNQPEKVVQLVQRTQLTPSLTLAGYDKLDALMELKKYDEVYRNVEIYKKTRMFDDFRLESYVLSVELERNDVASAERSCSAIGAIYGQEKMKAASLIYDQGLCEFLKIKKLDSQGQISLEDLVAQLNKVYSLKNDKVTLMALNEIIEHSSLKENNKKQFTQLMNKGWLIAQKYPLLKESLELSKNFVREQSKLPISLIYLQNWNVAFADMLEFKPLANKDEKWPEIKQNCDSRHYGDCMHGLETLYEETPSNDILENILTASLKAQDDITFKEFLQKYSEKSEAIERSKVWSVLTSNASEDILVNNDDNESLIAKNVSDFSRGDKSKGIDGLKKMISETPKSPMPYLFLARMYYEKNQSELALHVLENGYKNSNSRSLLGALYQINALIYANTNYSDLDSTQDQSPALQFAIAFSAMKNHDTQRVQKSLNTVAGLKNWLDMITAAQNIFNGTKDISVNAQTSSDYVQWLQNIYQLSQGSFEHLDKLKNFSIQKGFEENYGRIEQILDERAIATERK